MKSAILVGAGSWGQWWCEYFLPPNIRDGVLELAAVVDVDEQALAFAGQKLGLPADRLYRDVEKAFSERRADFCIIVVPPAQHEQIVEAAVRHGLHILSEKPIADTLEASVRIARMVRQSGIRMGVTMSHRFDEDKWTLRQAIHSGEYGPLDYLSCRFTCAAREFGSWGEGRHQMENPLLIEGSVHHLDFLADMAGAPCETLYAQTWKPQWAEYAGDCQALISMRYANGIRAVYEGAKANASSLNPWGKEAVRAECRDATLLLDRRELRVIRHVPGRPWNELPDRGERIPLLKQEAWGNVWLVRQFCSWLEGGPPMETNVQDNLQSVALITAAIISAKEDRLVRVQQLLKEARRAADR